MCIDKSKKCIKMRENIEQMALRGLCLLGEHIKKTDSRLLLLAILVQGLFCKDAPGDSNGLSSWETGL